MTLTAFLSEAASRPFAWGRCDCCLILADWLIARVGVDPAADLRSTYADEAGARRAIEAEGGLVQLLAGRLATIGMISADGPRPGDIGAVQVGDALFGAIACDAGWAIKSKRGIVISRRLQPVACWTFDA